MVNDWPAGTNATLGRQTLTDQARRYVLPVEVARAQAREAPKSPVPAPGEVDAAPWSGETRFEVGRYSVGRRVSFEQFSSRVKAVGRTQQQADELGLRVTYFNWRERPDGVFNGLSVEEIRIERTPGTSIQIYRAPTQTPGPSSLSHPLISKVSMPKEFGRVLGLSEK
jgi:hypothetical protein